MASLVQGRAPGDRLVEFSFRTLERLDQLTPAPVPTRLGPPSGAPGWLGLDIKTAFASSNGNESNTLRPKSNPSLCLMANSPAINSGVSLWPCDNTTELLSHWAWLPSNTGAGRIVLEANSSLCLSAVPSGLMETLSLQACEGMTGTSWQRGFGDNLIWTRTQQGLYADSIHPGARRLLDRVGPLLKSEDELSEQVLIGCYGWFIDLCIEYTGNLSQPLPVVSPYSPQWSAGNATYRDLQLLVRELQLSATVRGLKMLRLGILFVGWAKLYALQVRFTACFPKQWTLPVACPPWSSSREDHRFSLSHRLVSLFSQVLPAELLLKNMPAHRVPCRQALFRFGIQRSMTPPERS